jgi:hypothetical protein
MKMDTSESVIATNKGKEKLAASPKQEAKVDAMIVLVSLGEMNPEALLMYLKKQKYILC